jgi:hypothetical protein
MKKLISLTKNKRLLTIICLSIIFMSFDMELKERKVLDNKLSLLLPSNFTLMDDATLLVKYPNVGNRPNEVYTNAKGSVNVAFNHTANSLNESELSQVKEAIKAQLSRTTGVSIINTSEIKINESNYVIVEFISKAIDTQIYNKMFITALDGKLLLGTFNCKTSDLDKWESISKKIIGSIRK